MEKPRSSRSWDRRSTIGNGSFGTVSFAVEKSNGRAFAVKSVNLNSSPVPSIAALENEIRILKTLNSPYIVSYIADDTTREPPTAGLFRNLHMEYMSGGTIAAAAAAATAKAPMDETEIRNHSSCILHALHYLHSVAGVVHGDVKGRNVLLNGSGGAKLADFGSARRISDCVGSTSGTPMWMAPEVMRGENPSPASDMWSLGCTVIEMATGDFPWAGESPDVVLRIGYGCEVPEIPARISKSGRDFLEKCLRRDAGERWTAEQLLSHPFLTASLGDGGGTGPSPRSVLNWENSGFESDGDDMDEYLGSDSARNRIRELGSDVGLAVWESEEGWDVVRWNTDLSVEKGTCSEYLESTSAETEIQCGDASEASEVALSNGMRCNGYNGDKTVAMVVRLCWSMYKSMLRSTVVSAYIHILHFSLI